MIVEQEIDYKKSKERQEKKGKDREIHGDTVV